ncbi:hypothetical protein RAB80_009353 [Fusarium oxysporum f. sp. vasinfectum]|nr:hypothetical protein RAB80_009353 [Fusarium oxysporum f. sp. vasinfectum]
MLRNFWLRRGFFERVRDHGDLQRSTDRDLVGDPLPEVIDLTWDDSDEEPPPAHGSTNTVNIPRDLTPGSRRLAGAEETSDYIAKSVSSQRDSPERTHSAVTRTPENHSGAEQRPIAAGNSAVGQGDPRTGRIPISMLLKGAHS